MADLEDTVVPLVGLAIGAKIISNVMDDRPRRRKNKKHSKG